MRTLLMVLMLAVAPLWAAPKTVPLKVDGDTVLVVKSLPCTVTAPAGADFYLWTYPDNVKATALENVLMITAAPQGEVIVNVMAVTVVIDFDKKTKTTSKESGQITVTVGAAPAPKPVDPPPGPAPDAGLLAALKAGYALDKDADRDASRAKLAALYRVAARTAASPDVTTWGQLLAAIQAAGASTVGPAATVLPETRKAVSAHLKSKLPGVASQPLDADGRKLAAETFAAVALALEGVK